jgi:purine-binding chemotaxis protein CheW
MAKNRLETLAGAEGRRFSVVTFFLGEEECGLPITDVHQIIRDTPITRVPNVNPHVEGVINLRGIVTPIVDLRHRLGLGVRVLGENHRYLIVDDGGRMVGFSVDAVGGVLEYFEGEVQPASPVVLAKVGGPGVGEHCLAGVLRRRERVVILLSTSELLRFGNGVDVHTESRAGVSAGVLTRA